jgi:type IV pilus biogenesis protein CpaD/CtpE
LIGSSTPVNRVLVLMVAAAGLAACSKPDAADNRAAPTAATPPAGPVMPPSVAQNTDDPLLFTPLQSAAVKDAIHRALSSGQTQRWQDGKLSGYAVPSQTAGANGCRSVRYTVDQRPAGQFETITACDASR